MTDTRTEKVTTLNPGDEIRATMDFEGHTATLTGVAWSDGDALLVGTQVVSWSNSIPLPYITDVEVLTPADPGCPFPLGAKVRGKGSGSCRTVDGWELYRDYAGRQVWRFTSNGLHYDPDVYELIPEPAEPPLGSIVECPAHPHVRHVHVRKGAWLRIGEFGELPTTTWADLVEDSRRLDCPPAVVVYTPEAGS